MKNFRLKFVLAILVFVGGGYSAVAQELKGIVKDSSGNPVIGATVIVEGSTKGTSSNLDGEWTLSVPNAAGKNLSISYIGMQSQSIPIGNKTFFDVTLEDETTVLDDVVVVGYATVRRRDVVGSVSSVNAEALTQMPVASVSEALSGRMAGVSVTATEGDPDADIKIRVRGTGSITQDSSPLYIVDGFPVESISDIPASDIQSIDVLKDAFSTAIYGSRGANGVVLVTTKSGTSSRIAVNYNLYVGMKNMANKNALRVQNTYDFVRTQYENAILKGNSELNSRYVSLYGTWEDMDLYRDMPGNDWVDQIFGRTGISFDHNISVSGSGDKYKWTAGYSNHTEDAIMVGSDYKRDNLNLKAQFSPNKRVSFDISVRYSNVNVRGSGANALNDKGSSSTASRLANSIIYSPIPKKQLTADSDDPEDWSNSVRPDIAVKDNDQKRKRTNWNANAAFNWEIVDNLKLRVEAGLDDNRNITHRFYGTSTYLSRNSPVAPNLPIAMYSDATRNRIRSTNTLQYNFKKLLPKDHSLDILIGQEYMVTNANTMNADVRGLFDFYDADMAWKLMRSAANPTSAYVKYSNEDRLFSFFGRVNYDYKGRYSVSATMRADGSSKFARENYWGYFPSAAAAWRISGEEWMKGASRWLDNLKLRYSFGTAGNNDIPAGNILREFVPTDTQTNGLGNVYWAVGSMDTTDKVMPNPDLKWETTYSHNIGLDFSFWNSRLNGSVEVYQSNTKDLLIRFPVSGSGYKYQYRNLGEVRNRGIEVTLNSNIVRKERWGIDFSANIAFNENKVMTLGGRDEYSAGTGMFSSESWDEYIVKVGRPIGDIYGLVNDGMYTVDDFEGYDDATGKWILREGVASASGLTGHPDRPGAPKYKNFNGDNAITTADAVCIGNIQPLFTGGFSLSAYFYGFDLAANFTYSYGNKVYNANKVAFSSIQDKKAINALNSASPDNRWTNIDWTTGRVITDAATLAAVNEGKTMWSPYSTKRFPQSWALEDASFLRLGSLTLGYTVPERLTKRIRLNRVRVYVTGTNLFCWTPYTGYDPEVDSRRDTPLTPAVDYSAFPKSRSWVFGLNLSF